TASTHSSRRPASSTALLFVCSASSASPFGQDRLRRRGAHSTPDIARLLSGVVGATNGDDSTHEAHTRKASTTIATKPARAVPFWSRGIPVWYSSAPHHHGGLGRASISQPRLCSHETHRHHLSSPHLSLSVRMVIIQLV